MGKTALIAAPMTSSSSSSDDDHHEGVGDAAQKMQGAHSKTAISAEEAMRLGSKVDLSATFGEPLFMLSDKGVSAQCCGCDREEYDITAQFFPSILAVSRAEKHPVCCCCELPWMRNFSAHPKFTVIKGEFHDSIGCPCWDNFTRCCFLCYLSPDCKWFWTGCCKCCCPFRTTAYLTFKSFEESSGVTGGWVGDPRTPCWYFCFWWCSCWESC